MSLRGWAWLGAWSLAGALSCAAQPSPQAPGGPGPAALPPAGSAPASAAVAASGSGAAPASSAAEGWETFDVASVKTLFEGSLNRWSDATSCPDYDYHPNGGIRNFWCHRAEDITLANIRTLAGVEIFASGPHKGETMKFDAPHDFGHYNPAFVQWLVDKVAPSPRDSAARKITQGSYDTHMQPMATVFWQTYEKIKAEPECFEREKKLYAAGIKSRSLPRGYYERWFFFMNPFFCKRASSGQSGGPYDNYFYDNGFEAGVSGNVAKSAVGFWMRRSLDGTMDTFAAGLRKLIASYQPTLLAAQLPPPDPDALLKLIDTATRALQACRTDRTPPRTHVSLNVTTDGRVRLVKGRAAPELDTCFEQKLAPIQMSAFGGQDIPFNRIVNLGP